MLSDWPGAALTEAAVLERLRREHGYALDPSIGNAAACYDPAGRSAMQAIYREYGLIAARAGLPILFTAPTWRAQRHRVEHSPWRSRDVNGDCLRFLREVAAGTGARHSVGALIGPCGDCYRPSEAPDENASLAYHAWQIERLWNAGADFILAATLPALPESIGIARAAARSGAPCLISFVLGPDGRLLDGHRVDDAVESIESRTAGSPLGYFFNCTHWSFARRALEEASKPALGRILGLQANTAACPPGELEGAQSLITEPPDVFAEGLFALHRDFGIRILGGCCGSGPGHLQALADRLKCP